MPDRVFRLDRWGTVSPPTGWVIAAGAFLDPSRSDLLAYRPADGSLWVGANDGAGFTFTAPWATASPT